MPAWPRLGACRVPFVRSSVSVRRFPNSGGCSEGGYPPPPPPARAARRAGRDSRLAGANFSDRLLFPQCLAFDATAAFRVRDPALLARERPDDLARRHVAREDIEMVCALAARRGFKVPRGPPDMDVRTFVALAAGQAGFHPSKRQPLPGTQKVWEGTNILWNAVIGHKAMSKWKKDREMTE